MTTAERHQRIVHRRPALIRTNMPGRPSPDGRLLVPVSEDRFR